MDLVDAVSILKNHVPAQMPEAARLRPQDKRWTCQNMLIVVASNWAVVFGQVRCSQ